MVRDFSLKPVLHNGGEQYLKAKKEYKRRENIRGKKNYQEKLKSQGKFTEKEDNV